MKEVTSRAFILKTLPYKEKDRLVYVYTQDYGKITLLAKGVNQLKSKNAASMQELTLVEITFIPKKGVCTLIRAQIIDFYREIKENLTMQIYAMYFNEYIYKQCEENNPDLKLFNLIKESYDKLKIGYHEKLIYSLFNLFMLKHSGYYIEVNQCVHCHSQQKIVSISVQDSGFICQNCIQKEPYYSIDILKLFRHLNLIEIKDIDKLKYRESDLETVSNIIEVFVEEYSGLYFQTKKFM